jgi:sulfatase maturation enzyme AslB (radical SAM superfamily)
MVGRERWRHVSMDGEREQQDAMRVFANGKGSYDVVIPAL